MSHQPGNTYQPPSAQAHGGDTDPNETRRLLGQQNVPQSNGQMSAQSHGGNTDPNEVRRQLGQHVPGQSNNQTWVGQQPTSQYTPQTSATVPYSTGSSPNVSRTSSQATQQQVYRSVNQPHGPVQYQIPHTGQPQLPYQQAAHYVSAQKTPTHELQPLYGGNPPMRDAAHYVPAEQTPTHGIQPAYGGNAYQQPSYPSGGYSASRGLKPQPVIQEIDSTQNIDTVEKQNYRPQRERGYSNLFHDRVAQKWKWPNFYQVPGIRHPGTAQAHHKDAMGRATHFMPEDYYLSPTDFHLAKLMVQCSQEVYDANPNSTWRRTFVRDVSPLLLRVANWALESIPTEERPMTGEEYVRVGAKWIPANIALLILLCWPESFGGRVRNGGKYDPFPYRYWGYPYHGRNKIEDRPISPDHFDPYSSSEAEDMKPQQGISDRPIEPNFLCFLKAGGGVTILDVEEWKLKNPGQVPEYVVISYTSEQFKNDKEELLLHDVGELAARKAGVPAYWVGCSCLGNDDQKEQNVWRISDIIRGAHSMAIVLSNPTETKQVLQSKEELLKQWGSRVWTLPEILLCPGTQEIAIYTRGEDLDSPMKINKRNIASTLDDGKLSRQLIDHYEGSLILGPLELITIALRCLHGREKGKYLKGDMSYALMGLLRQRPTVVRGDSAFQAFARLSLANDSNMLLERMICILPKRYDQPWHSTDDQWNVQLWDIYPTTQICGIGERNTVILDNAHAANIRWKSFTRVLALRKDSFKRQVARYTFRSTFYLLFIGVILIIVGGNSTDPNTGAKTSSSPMTAAGAFFLTIGLILTLLSPYIIHILYRGKIWATQPWFMGFEGYMSLPNIEKRIFGADMGRLSWSTNGSPLSRHQANAYDECEGLDPITDPGTAARVQRAITSRMGDEKIFTLVDTCTMTVTMFAAVRPPVAVVLCGQEGGMQRAVLCSYEHSTQTLYRETVLRMETPVLEVMSRLGRFRFGLNRQGTEETTTTTTTTTRPS